MDHCMTKQFISHIVIWNCGTQGGARSAYLSHSVMLIEKSGSMYTLNRTYSVMTASSRPLPSRTFPRHIYLPTPPLGSHATSQTLIKRSFLHHSFTLRTHPDLSLFHLIRHFI